MFRQLSDHVYASPQIGLAEVAMRENLGLIGYSPLASGTLTGKYAEGQAIAASLAQAVPPGVPVPRHSHNAEEQVTVLEGLVKIRLGDREQVCQRFDSTLISANVEHELVNVGEKTAYVLVVYGSPDVNRTFAGSGETVGIGSEDDRF